MQKRKKCKKPAKAEERFTEEVQRGILASLSSDVIFHQLFTYFTLEYLFKTGRLVCSEWNLFITGRSVNDDDHRYDKNSSRYSLVICKSGEKLNSLMTCIQEGYFRNLIRKLYFREFDSFCQPSLVRNSGMNQLVPQISENLLDEAFPHVEEISIVMGNSDSSLVRQGFCKNKLEKLKSLNIIVIGKNISYSEMFASNFMRNLRFLDLDNCNVDDQIMLQLSECPLTNLEKLRLGYNEITQSGTLSLSKSKYLSKLKHLDLTYNDIGNEGLRYLCESENLQNISELLLEFNRISNLEPLLKTENMKNLWCLDLCRCSLDLENIMSLISCQNLPNLAIIRLYHAKLTGVHFTSSHVISKSIQRLDLNSCNLDDTGLECLLNSLKYDSITELNLAYNEIGNKGLEHLSQCLYLNNLKKLNISGNELIDKDTFIYFIELVRMPNIKELNVSYIASINEENVREIVIQHFPNITIN